jgi:hypothetical protein
MTSKRKKPFKLKPPAEKMVTAYLCPDKIIVITKNVSGESMRYLTDNLTLLPADVDDATLGNTIIHHIQQSKDEFADYDSVRANYEYFKKQAKFKSEIQTVKNAKLLNIILTEESLCFEPYRAVLSPKTYLRIPEAIVNIPSDVNAETIGRQSKLSWKKCTMSNEI